MQLHSVVDLEVIGVGVVSRQKPTPHKQTSKQTCCLVSYIRSTAVFFELSVGRTHLWVKVVAFLFGKGSHCNSAQIIKYKEKCVCAANYVVQLVALKPAVEAKRDVLCSILSCI